MLLYYLECEASRPACILLLAKIFGALPLAHGLGPSAWPHPGTCLWAFEGGGWRSQSYSLYLFLIVAVGVRVTSLT